MERDGRRALRGWCMTAVTPLTADPDARKADAAAEMTWPSERAGFYALFVIILATFLSFFDMTVFGMLAERIKTSFQLGDAALGFVLGPATVLAYVFIGIPLARLVDIYPRKYVLSAGIAIIGS